MSGGDPCGRPPRRAYPHSPFYQSADVPVACSHPKSPAPLEATPRQSTWAERSARGISQIFLHSCRQPYARLVPVKHDALLSLLVQMPFNIRPRNRYSHIAFFLQSLNYYQEYLLLAFYSMEKLYLRHNYLVNICHEHRCTMVKSIKSKQVSAQWLSCSLFTLFTRRHILIRRSTSQGESS